MSHLLTLKDYTEKDLLEIATAAPAGTSSMCTIRLRRFSGGGTGVDYKC